PSATTAPCPAVGRHVGATPGRRPLPLHHARPSAPRRRHARSPSATTAPRRATAHHHGATPGHRPLPLHHAGRRLITTAPRPATVRYYGITPGCRRTLPGHARCPRAPLQPAHAGVLSATCGLPESLASTNGP